MQKKCGKKRLVKIVFLSQGVSSSQLTGASNQATLSEAVLPLFVVLVEFFPQVTGVFSDLVWVSLAEGLDVEDNLPIAGQLNRKKKAFANSTEARVQTEAVEEFPMVGEVLVLPSPHYGLDVPKKEGAPARLFG